MMFTLLEQQMYEDIALYGIILICCLFSFCFYQCPVIVFSNCPIYFVEIVISHASEVISFRKMSIFQWVSPIYFRCNLQGVTSMMFSAFFGMLPLHFLKPFSIKNISAKWMMSIQNKWAIFWALFQLSLGTYTYTENIANIASAIEAVCPCSALCIAPELLRTAVNETSGFALPLLDSTRVQAMASKHFGFCV